jgi:predicted metal-dependent HD superfamily phosphohydrolase
MPRPETDSRAVLDPDRWRRLMRVLGFAENAQTLAALVRAYSETHRHYHTAGHIAACLALLDAHAAQADRPHEIELALWFHDAVYQPLSGENEQKSADWAARFVSESGAPREVADRMRGLILSTRHHAPLEAVDGPLLLDIDLAILGADAVTYDVYEAAIQQEYRMVPAMIYRSKRVEVLEAFLRRPAIYLTPDFRSAREKRAHANLARAISRLSA